MKEGERNRKIKLALRQCAVSL